MMDQYVISIAILYVFSPICICVYLGEPLDVANVLRLEQRGENDFLPYGKLVIEARGDARGLPTINTTLRPNETPCCRNWTNIGWYELDPDEATKTFPLLETNVSQVWALGNAVGELVSPPGPQNKGSNVCVTVLARLPENSSLLILARLPTGTPETKVIELKGSRSDSWIVRRIDRKGHRSFRNKQLQLVLRAKRLDFNESVLVQWASFCNTHEDTSTHAFDSNFTSSNATSIFPDAQKAPTLLANRFNFADSVCTNGGQLNAEYSVCECAPGFSGGVCEKGCGRNTYGVHCEGKCSKETGRNCKGVFICSKRTGCACVSGLEGEKCETPCHPGYYGSGCKLKCGVCADGRTCDPYTGECHTGCEGPRQPPFCDYECGHISATSPLISYAEDAAAEDFPWHVGVYMKHKLLDPQINCGGTLVRPKYVISAAHCFYSDLNMKQNRAEQYCVAFGKTFNDWSAQEDHPDRIQYRDVLSIHIPELYRGMLRSYAHDIALLKLSRPVDVTPYVVPICFDWSGGYELELEEGELGTVVGWGKTEKGVTSRTLQKAELPYVPVEECLESIPETIQKFVTEDKFCVGKTEGVGVTVVNRGDSGGGLIVRQGPAWFLRGVVSVGLPDRTSLTVYTNVSHFRSWITSTWNLLDIEEAVSFNINISYLLT